MKHPKKGESYYEKTFGKSRPEAASEPSEAKKTGKTNWRNKSDFSEAPVRRGKNEVAAPKEMRGRTDRDRDDRKGGAVRNPKSGAFREETAGYKKDKPAFRKDDRDFRKDKPAFRKDNGDFRKDDTGFRKDKPAFRKDDGDERRVSGEFRKERPAFKKDRPDFRKAEGEERRERPASGRDNKASKNEKPAFRKGDGDSRKGKPSFTQEAPLSLHAENEVVKEKIGSGKGKNDVISETPLTEAMPLNKYIAHCGICSRRDAAELIRQGKVKINGELVTEPGHKVEDGDQITVSGRKVSPQKDLTYILLNKPKGFITTTEDERGRRTVMDLVSDSGALRLYPIGRLDRNTTGLILLTNDGELSQKLSHPKYNVKKIYHVTLDKAISAEDFEKILAGVELEDGVAPVDSLAMLEERNELGIEIHSGKNRIVRRIFEHLGYEVARLDRVMYAGLTKKNLPRGKWRKLTEREVIFLKHFKQ